MCDTGIYATGQCVTECYIPAGDNVKLKVLIVLFKFNASARKRIFYEYEYGPIN